MAICFVSCNDRNMPIGDFPTNEEPTLANSEEAIVEEKNPSIMPLDTVPLSIITEKDIQTFAPLSENEFKDITRGTTYSRIAEYICLMDSGKVYYYPEAKDCPEPQLYNVLNMVEGGGSVHITFFDNYMTGFFSGSDGYETWWLKYYDFKFDVKSQIVLSELNWESFISCNKNYKIAFVNKDYLIVENSLRNGYSKYAEQGFYARELFKRNQSKLPTPLKTSDYRTVK